jgi:hypothetical protein
MNGSARVRIGLRFIHLKAVSIEKIILVQSLLAIIIITNITVIVITISITTITIAIIIPIVTVAIAVTGALYFFFDFCFALKKGR